MQKGLGNQMEVSSKIFSRVKEVKDNRGHEGNEGNKGSKRHKVINSSESFWQALFQCAS